MRLRWGVVRALVVTACGLMIVSRASAWSLESGAISWDGKAGTEAWTGHGTWDGAADGDGIYHTLSIHVFKQRHELVLKQGDQVLRSFPVALGRQPVGMKEFRGDNRTPEGRYYVCDKNANSRFHRFLGISYPNRDDADRAFAQRLITANQWADIFFANLRRSMPPASTLLGGRVGIHGHGGREQLPIDWTEGCIAVGDSEIEYLYDVVPIGTPVIITD
jgi:L,D-transpeptidase-like protein